MIASFAIGFWGKSGAFLVGTYRSYMTYGTYEWGRERFMGLLLKTNLGRAG